MLDGNCANLSSLVLSSNICAYCYFKLFLNLISLSIAHCITHNASRSLFSFFFFFFFFSSSHLFFFSFFHFLLSLPPLSASFPLFLLFFPLPPPLILILLLTIDTILIPKMFTIGSATLPEQGMGKIGDILASKIPEDNKLFNTR